MKQTCIVTAKPSYLEKRLKKTHLHADLMLRNTIASYLSVLSLSLCLHEILRLSYKDTFAILLILVPYIIQLNAAVQSLHLL